MNNIEKYAWSLMGVNPKTIAPNDNINLQYINPYKDYPMLNQDYLYNNAFPYTQNLYNTPMYADLYNMLLNVDRERYNGR